MNPQNLIDQATGRILPGMVMQFSHKRAAFLAARGHSYRAVFAEQMRLNWETARNYAGYWKMAHSAGSSPMLYTGGNQGLVEGVSHEGGV
jgi:hypothetical protein